MMKNRKKLCIIASILILCIAAGCIIYGFYSGAIPNVIRRIQNKDEQEITQVLPKPEKTEETIKPEQAAESNEIVEDTKVTEQDPLLDDPITITDTYCIEGDEAAFYAYEADADQYIWEYYNKKTAQWDSVSELPDAGITKEQDEYYREVSVLSIPAKVEYDGVAFRCSNENQTPEEEIDEGVLYVIQPFDELTVPEEYSASAKELLYTNEIPVTITYKDRDSMEIKGLQGLYFCYEVSSTEDITKDLNEITKTVTTISKEERSYMTMPGDNPIMLRYRSGSNTSDYDINIIGVDKTAPIIESYEVSEYEVLSNDTAEGVEITVDIRAEDNCTETFALMYCFELEGESNPEKDHFIQDSSITISTNTNGMYAIYVMDEAGNIAKETTELIIVDTKAPVITSVSLEYPDMNKWYESNIIHVVAEDKTTLSYQYTCNGMDSGYIRDDFYTITENGMWTVTVKDAAGNVTSKDIEITNIDRKPPTILNISQNHNNQGTVGNLDYSSLIIGYDEDGNPIYASDILNGTEETTVINGIDGKDGADGKDGIDGKDGVNGKDGIDGRDGRDGKDGTDGASITGAKGDTGNNGNSVFIRYSAYENGADMTESPTASTKYIGTYTGTKASTNPSQYSWSKYAGDDGNSVFIRYSADADGSEMTEKPTALSKYMGTYVGKTASVKASDYNWTRYSDATISYSDGTLYITQ